VVIRLTNGANLNLFIMEQIFFTHREAVIFLGDFIENPARIAYELEVFYKDSFISLFSLQNILKSL